MSRRDPERTLDLLLTQSHEALDRLAVGLAALYPAAAAILAGTAMTAAPGPDEGPRIEATPASRALSAPAAVLLVDVGSGNGIPGIPWHLQLRERLGAVGLRTYLVEPRRKRAWFLQRMSHLIDPGHLQVIEGRWEDGPHAALAAADLAGPRLWILVLRALNLPEDALVEHLARHVGRQAADDGRLTIRFRGTAADLAEPAGASPMAPGARGLLLPPPPGVSGPLLQVRWYPPGTPSEGVSP